MPEADPAVTPGPPAPPGMRRPNCPRQGRQPARKPPVGNRCNTVTLRGMSARSLCSRQRINMQVHRQQESDLVPGDP